MIPQNTGARTGDTIGHTDISGKPHGWFFSLTVSISKRYTPLRNVWIIARLNNIPVSGTLGVLIKAKKMGIIESVKELMDRLRTDHHYWVNDAMYNKVLSLSNE